jgi:hypothetical protein
MTISQLLIAPRAGCAKPQDETTATRGRPQAAGRNGGGKELHNRAALEILTAVTWWCTPSFKHEGTNKMICSRGTQNVGLRYTDPRRYATCIVQTRRYAHVGPKTMTYMIMLVWITIILLAEISQS